MTLIGRTWEDDTPESLDNRIGRLLKGIAELEADKKAYHIANEGKTIGKRVVSPDYKISWSVVEYFNNFYTLTCSQSMKGDALVAWCDVHEGKSLYETFRKRYGESK